MGILRPLSLAVAVLAVTSMLSSCLLNRSADQAAVDAPPPPPAAYPDSSGGGGGELAASGAPTPPTGTAGMAPAPPSAPAAPAAPAPFQLREGEQLVAHEVQSGENLTVIAARYNTTVSRIQAANGMTDTRIFAGRTIQVPTAAAAAPGSPVTSASFSSGAVGNPSSAPTPPPSSPYGPLTGSATPPAPSLGAVAPSPLTSSGESYVGPSGSPPAPPTPPSAPASPSSTSYPRTLEPPGGMRLQTSPATPAAGFPTPRIDD